MKYKKLFFIMFMVILLVTVLTGSVAYYRTTVEGKIIGSTGNAVFNVTGLADSSTEKVIDLGNKLLPGDRGSFDITLDSTGSTVDMYVTLKISRGVLPNNLKFYSTSDYKSEISTYYSLLNTSGVKSDTLTIYWYWNPFIDNDDDNKYVGKSLSANLSIEAKQISEYATMKNDNGAKTEFWSDTYKPYIRTITFGNDLSNLPSNCTEENLCWDISYSTTQNKKVYGYLVESGLVVEEKDTSTSTTTTKSLYNLYIVSEASIFAPTRCSQMFYGFKKLTQINFNSNFNTSNVTDMSSMFSYCSSLTNLDLSSFNTSKVTNMHQMFNNCSSLTSLDLSNFNTSSVTAMEGMFYNFQSLTSLDLSNFNTSSVTNMNGMFQKCLSLISLDLDSFNTSSVTDMSSMFLECSTLTSLDLSNFNTSSVTTMGSMFAKCSSLINLDLSGFNTSKVADLSGLFMCCYNLEIVDLSMFNTSSVTNMNGMFYKCSSLTKLDLSNFNTSSLTSVCGEVIYSGGVVFITGIFEECKNLVSVDLSSFNTSNITNFNNMFKGCSKLQTQINIMNSNATNYTSMFSGAATDSNAKITVNYIAGASTLVDNMIATKSSNSNVVKGVEI